MCVAVIVQSEKRIPKDNLKAMHETNPDGGGVAWTDGKVVHFRKGLTWEEINELQDKLPRPFLMHFRIATKGDKIPELTHPFPIGLDAFSEDLTGFSEKGVIIHNGTWPDFRKYIPGGLHLPDNRISDTQIAAYMAAFNEEILENVRWSNAIMYPHQTYYRGNWEKHEGNLYSNLHWRRELWRSDEYWKNWKSHQGTPYYSGSSPYTGRTITPYDSRKKGAHRDNHNQENGRTVNQYQTQFSKSGGATAHQQKKDPVQSNGKTLSQNRAAKSQKNRKTQPMKSVTYEEAVKTYNDSKGQTAEVSVNLNNNPDVNMLRQRGADWDGERLFQPEELVRSRTQSVDFYDAETGEWEFTGKNVNVDLAKYLGPSVPCPDCKEDIKQIPCDCGMDSEEALELALEAKQLEDLTGMDPEDCIEIAKLSLDIARESESEQEPIGFNDAPSDGIPLATTEGNVSAPHLTEVVNECKAACNSCKDVSDCALLEEDMNAYGMSAGVDGGLEGLDPPGDYLDENWAQVQETIKAQGIKI